MGPDYIDPMFHTAATNRPCRNLDPVLTSEAYVRDCFASHCQEVDYALVEGVMGLFDGVRIEDSDPDFASTAHIARLLDLPIILVIDCSRLSGSVAAIAHGYRSFDSRINLAGVILNRVGSDRHLDLLKDALEPLNLPIFGILRRQEDITIPDRHLGLIPTAELEYLESIFERLAHLAKTCFDWDKLLPLLKSKVGVQTRYIASVRKSKVINPKSKIQNPSHWSLKKASLKIAIARDRAFNFYYQDNLDILEQLGAELIFWSPIEDELPEDIYGLYFGGGFPEVFAKMLAENILARTRVRQAILTGMPTYAECGGLMYLCEQLVDFDKQNYSMVGVIPTTTVMGKRLTLGYRRAIALHDSLLFKSGESIWGHEFHRSQLTSSPQQPIFDLQGSIEGWQFENIHASYVHLHFGGNLTVPQKFLDRCLQFSRKIR
ncbi:MAG: cobyrinate a,c-diamide synthase [Hydrococcus sp. Prado102]|nr:cobyrinate a,c-diamide synthase [Hydrococcus sp. Prado102]